MPTPKLVKKLTKVRYSRNGTKIIIGVGDFVNVVSDNAMPYVARITEIGATAKGAAHATMQWMYRTQDLRSKPPSSLKKNEIFYATHSDVNPMESVIEQVKVQFTDAKGDTYLTPVFEENKGANYPIYICSMEYQPEGDVLIKLSSERIAEIKAGSIPVPQSTPPLQLASSSSKSDGPAAGKLSPIKHAKLVSRIASPEQGEMVRPGEPMAEKEATGSPSKGSVRKEQTSAQSRSRNEDQVKPVSLAEVDEVVREQATEPVKSPTKEARIRKSQSALKDQDRAEVNSPKTETKPVGSGMADTIGTLTTATAKTARPLANVKRRFDDIEDKLPKEKATEQVEVENPTAISASKTKKSRILEDAEDDDRTETASPTSASKSSVDRSVDAKDGPDAMSEIESEKGASDSLDTGNGSRSRAGKNEPVLNSSGTTAVAIESSAHDDSKSQMEKPLEVGSGAVAKTVGQGENGQQITVDMASPLRDGRKEKKDVKVDFVSKGSCFVAGSNEATESSLELQDPKQGIKQARGETAILSTKTQPSQNVVAADKTNISGPEGVHESSKKEESDPNERNVLAIEGSAGGEQGSFDSKQQSALKPLPDELSPQSTIQKDLSDQNKTAAAAAIPTAPSGVVPPTTPPIEETERPTNESASEGDVDESFTTLAATPMLHDKSTSGSSQRLSVTVNDSQRSPELLPSSPAARNLPVSPRPTRTRIGPAYQAIIPAYLGPGPLAPTAQDKLVWSPYGASQEKMRHEIDLEAYQLMKDRLRRRGSVVPVAILEPGAHAASDRKRVFWARIHETITTEVNRSGTIKVIPVDSTWPETPGDLASFKMKPEDSERAFEVPKRAVFVPETLTERCLLREYRRRQGGASSYLSSSTDQDNGLPSFTQEELQWTQGVGEMYERWSRKDYDEFAMALRNAKDRSLLRNVYNEMTSTSKAITLTDVVNMFSMSSRTGVSTAIAGMVTCSSCKTIQSSVISCVRYHDCRIAVCHSCFTNAKPFSKYIESDGDTNQPKSFEALKYSHWFCRYCLRKMAKKDLKHGLPPQSSSTTPPPPPTSGLESSAAGAAARETTESTIHHASSSNQSSTAAAGFRTPSTAATALRIRTTLSSSSSSPSPSSSSPHSSMTTVPDVLLEYDEGRLSAEEALNQIRQLMLAEASKALRLKRPRLPDPGTSRSNAQ